MKHKILNFIKNKEFTRIKIIIIIAMILFTVSLSSICFAYYYTQGSFTANTTVRILEFNPLVNSSANNSQSINLTNTITNNMNFAPGAEGKFIVDINFTNVASDSYYELTYDRTGIPNNLKFYVDEDYTTEFSSIKGVTYTDYSNQIAEHYVYWKWIVDDSTDSNTNDSLYMGQNISVDFNVYISQKVDENTFEVNDMERPSGRINIVNTHAGNNKGSFHMLLNLTNATANTQYRIYFNEKELSDDLHLYSDSEYQHEINYIQGTYNGNNNYILRIIYWKLDTGNVSSLNDGLYYIVVFGSW